MDAIRTEKTTNLRPGTEFLSHLVACGRLDAAAAERARHIQQETLDRLSAVMLKLGLLSEAALAEEMSNFCGFPSVAPHQSLVAAPLDDLPLTQAFLRAHEILLLSADERGLTLSCWDALDDYAIRAVAFAVRKPVQWRVATRSQIQRAWTSVGDDAALPAQPMQFNDDEVDRLKDLASEAPVIRLVRRVINEAVRRKASDIHFETSENTLHIRFRTDGLLSEVEAHPRETAAPVVSRIKVMAGINIAERRLPQDGRIRVGVEGKEIDFRVATAPTLHGESVVMRILDRQDVSLDFDALGFDGKTKSVIRSAISRPHGIVLVTGPTGSGKTTTLYAALKEVSTPDKKILTVEDPVEYVLEGINQVTVRPQIGLTFAHALRSFLRHDPDIMMVGEIRDKETAEIAIQAALTGHLVLSTLHTNTAAAAITRLLDMGIDDYLLTSTVHLILGQRLVRRLCAHCRESYRPDEAAQQRLHISGSQEHTWYRAVGCARCQGGYAGRTTIAETLVVSDAVRTRILSHGDAHQIEEIAVTEGMRTLFRHGVERVEAGTTTAEEVLRVTNLA
jgi:general secretion pathway protein E